MSGKRSLDIDGQDGDSKRIRSNDGSPAPAPHPPVGLSDIERKKQEAAARMAAVKAKLAASRPNGAASSAAAAPPAAPSSSTDSVEAKRAEAQRKIAEMKARMAAQRQGATASPVNGRPAVPPPPQGAPDRSDVQARIAEARAKAAALASQRNGTHAAPTPPPPPRQESRGARGGLGIGLHPSLLGDLGAPIKSKGQQGPKFSTTKGNQQADPVKTNPYLTPETAERRDEDPAYDPALIVSKGGERKSRQLIFNQKGKFIAQANALKQQARMEEMKRRLAAEARKTEIEEAGDRAFLVSAPPDVEWWDEGLLPAEQKSYEEWETPGRNRIETEDTIITRYVQHPVLLQPPQDKFLPAPKPMPLTEKEQKKLRRQRRMADMKEKQAEIRLGLVEPPPPKVKKSNMMRVLGEQAVKDPTAVEARVNREIAQRAYDHDKANEDRKLTKEERAEKLKTQQEGDEARGVKMAVFRVENLSSGKNRYKIDINAKQNSLSGIVVLHPTMNLVIVEGGVHSIRAYKKLMLERIDWAENSLPLSSTAPTTFTRPANKQNKESTGPSQAWLNPMTEHGDLKDLTENCCQLVWEGDERQRAFKKWFSRVCETDGEARDVLKRNGMENMWTLARSMVS